MSIRAYAPGGRIQAAELRIIKRHKEGGSTSQLAERLGLSLRHVQRIVQRQHWAEGWLPPQTPDVHRKCVECGTKFSRRMDNGRLRAPKVWARMVCCGNSCNLRRAWRMGKFEGRSQ